MDILNKIKLAREARDRTVSSVDAKLNVVLGLEQKVNNLADQAVAPAIRDMDSMAAELTEMASAFEGNGGPPLDGEKPSTPSAGQSPEGPTKPQS